MHNAPNKLYFSTFCTPLTCISKDFSYENVSGGELVGILYLKYNVNTDFYQVSVMFWVI